MSFHPKSFSEAQASFKPMKRGQMSRGKLKPRRVSRKASVDGDSEKLIRAECDNLVRDIVKLRDLKCVIFDCIATEGLQVGHYVKRGVLALRWDLRNCNAQCSFHNEAHNTDRKPYRDAMILRYGIGVSFRIEEIGRINPRVEYIELLSIRDGLRSELERLKGNNHV